MRSGFFNSEITGYDMENMPIFDRAEEASFFAKYFSEFIANGVFPNPSTGMQVVANSGMTVKVLEGCCYINGYMGWVESAETLTISDVTNQSRIDRIVARWSLEDRNITLAILKGTESGNPVAPDLTRDGDIYEIALADISLNQNTIEITDADITDLRLNTELCGIVTGAVEQVDTTTLFNQYQSWLETTTKNAEENLSETLEQFTNDFNTWFENLQYVLSDDVAGKLEVEIEENKTAIEENKAIQDEKIDNLTNASNANRALFNIMINNSQITTFSTDNMSLICDFYGLTDMSYMFYYCENLVEINLCLHYTNTYFTPENTRCMFYYCTGLKTLDLSRMYLYNITDMSFMFYYCTGLTTIIFNNSKKNFNVTDMSSMFYYCSGLTTLDLSNFDTSNVTDMSSMFYRCSGLKTLDLSNFDTSNVTDMSSMFDYCSGLTTLDLSNFDTSNVTDMSSMFYYCSGLTTLDLSNFDTSNVTDMSSMFYYCSGLKTLDLSNFDTSNVTDMSSMFRYCTDLKTIYVSDEITKEWIEEALSSSSLSDVDVIIK